MPESLSFLNDLIFSLDILKMWFVAIVQLAGAPLPGAAPELLAMICSRWGWERWMGQGMVVVGVE